jgi:hypothetical protein
MFIAAALNTRGIPFNVRKTNKSFDLNDGFGSYICEYGYLHNYRKLKPKLDEVGQETIGSFNSVDELMKSLNDE